jgi:hypothetical protein
MRAHGRKISAPLIERRPTTQPATWMRAHRRKISARLIELRRPAHGAGSGSGSQLPSSDRVRERSPPSDRLARSFDQH